LEVDSDNLYCPLPVREAAVSAQPTAPLR
jgi:hypothetical protein